MKTLIASVMLALIGGAAYSGLHDHTKCEGFLPENDLKIPVGTTYTSGGGITEEEFNEALDRIERVYTPILEARGKTLDVRRLWENETVNASAQQFGDRWVINMYGGLARHEAVGVEAFTTVACHEMGHHLGGAPKYGFFNSWASNEGQSDYYATLKCMRLLYSAEENEEYVKNVELDEYARALCDKVYKVEGESIDRLAYCYRSAVSAQDIAVLFQMLRKMDTKPEFNTPDTKEVDKTSDRHPMPQCRLDTYFNGALCPVSEDIDVDDKDATLGTCNRANIANEEGDQTEGDDSVEDIALPENAGTRPLCWFKPGKSGGGGDLPFPFSEVF